MQIVLKETWYDDVKKNVSIYVIKLIISQANRFFSFWPEVIVREKSNHLFHYQDSETAC